MGRKTLLLAEDDGAMRYALERLLQPEFAVTTAADNAETKSWLRKSSFDLVLLDLDLGGVRSWGLLQAVRSARPETPVVLMTAHPGQKDAALRAGAAGFLEKPFDVDALLHLVRELAGQPFASHSPL